MAIICRLGSGGGAGGSDGLSNFPLTISPTEPEPVREGHIWVKTEQTYKRAKLAQALIEAEEDDTLILVVGKKGVRLDGSEMFSLTYSTEFSIELVYDNFSWGTGNNWDISYNDSNDLISSFSTASPIVIYGKKNGIVNYEESYIWNGEKWNTITALGSNILVYLRHINGNHLSTPKNYIMLSDTESNITLDTIFSLSYSTTSNSHTPYIDASFGGQYIVIGYEENCNSGGIYKKTSDTTWDLYFAFNANITLDSKVHYFIRGSEGNTTCYVTPDGEQAAMLLTMDGGFGIYLFRNNGETFIYESTAYESTDGYYLPNYWIGFSYGGSLRATSDLSLILINGTWRSGGETYHNGLAFFRNIDGSYELSTNFEGFDSTSGYSFTGTLLFSDDETFMLTAVRSASSGSVYYRIVLIDYDQKKLTSLNSVSNSYSWTVKYKVKVPTSIPTDFVFVVYGQLSYGATYQYIFNIYDSITQTNTPKPIDLSIDSASRFSFSLDGRYAYIIDSKGVISRYTYDLYSDPNKVIMTLDDAVSYNTEMENAYIMCIPGYNN